MKHQMLSAAPEIIIQNANLAFNNAILFNNLNLIISARKLTCLLGPSGVGKTTLLRMIANLVVENDKTTYNADISTNPPIRLSKNIAYMGQTDLLLPWLNTLDNIIIGSRLRGKDNKEFIIKAKKMLEQVGLKQCEHKYPHELSGGMRQRVALIRTLLEEKPIILMDEPFSALDAITRFELQNLTADLLKDITVLLITHDPMEALRIADEIYVLSGQPANIQTTLHLTSLKPRNLADPDVIKYQEVLFEALMQAKGDS